MWLVDFFCECIWAVFMSKEFIFSIYQRRFSYNYLNTLFFDGIELLTPC